ncbi:MAG TPA: hypothetical protein VIN06_04445 [Devosia sp.]
MSKFRVSQGVALAATLAMAAAPVLAQEQVQMVIDRGATPERPYTLVYPEILQPVDDGSDVTVQTLRHPDAVMQCDAMIQDGAGSDWSAESAVENLDVKGITSTWSPDFPGFKVTGHRLTNFQSGPALMFEAESDSSPLGVPLKIVHAEATDNGRFYALECLVERDAANDARPMIDFLIANFSTRSDGGCCIDPADPRG